MSFGYNVTVHNDILKNRYKKINRQQVLIHMSLIVLLDSQEYVKKDETIIQVQVWFI